MNLRRQHCRLLLLLPGLLAGCARFESKPVVPSQYAARFDARSLEEAGLRGFLEANLQREFTDWPPATWDFQTLTLAAFYHHPSLEVARAQYGVARAGIQTAGGRLNPVLSVTPGISGNPPSGVSAWLPAVSVDVPIETAGKRQKRITHAQHLSDAARYNILTTAWHVRSQLRTVLLELNAVQRRADILQRQRELQEQLVKLLEQRLAAGTIAATEVAPARIARLKSLAEAADAQRQLAEIRVRLGEALGVPALAVRSLRLSPAPLFPSDAADKFLAADARGLALQQRADILSALAEYAAAESLLRLEIAKQYPDVHLNPGYQFDQGEHKWTLGLSMELPLLNRNEGPIAEALAKREEAAARFLAVQALVVAEIDRAAQGHAAVNEQLKNSEAVLEAQQRQVETIQASFQAGGADRFEADSARLEAALAEMAVLDARTRAAHALGQLEDALQIPFDALLVIDKNPHTPPTQEKP
jgi:outer membrane protein TolC